VGAGTPAAIDAPRVVIRMLPAGRWCEQFGRFNPGRVPVTMRTIGSAFVRSVEGWRTGEIIRAW
jgi:hypothetical protein